MSKPTGFEFDREAARKGVGCRVDCDPRYHEPADGLKQRQLELIEDRPPIHGVVVLSVAERNMLCKEARRQMEAEGRIIAWSNV
jgi:hypothetical protein